MRNNGWYAYHSKTSRSPNDRFKGQRYNTRTTHRSGQPFFGLGPWLMYQEEKAAKT